MSPSRVVSHPHGDQVAFTSCLDLGSSTEPSHFQVSQCVLCLHLSGPMLLTYPLSPAKCANPTLSFPMWAPPPVCLILPFSLLMLWSSWSSLPLASAHAWLAGLRALGDVLVSTCHLDRLLGSQTYMLPCLTSCGFQGSE